ncbi:unnamed protein product [Rotaria sordida]|uniref:Uncharacterized protein n=1 Tax=Rotaria sordida TaxID=392033 RepID=A0A814G4Q8_9BILA|nr:unnamed protein product [Rotaria sordida]CAF3835993.1 unnamed protein product [Rotaria sordida]
MKTLEDLDNDEQEDVETASSVLTKIVDQAVGDDAKQNDDIGLAAQIAKHSITSESNIENDSHEMKCLRNN